MDLGNIAMVVEESVRYSFTNPESRDEWYSAFPFGMGSIRLGPDYRAFFIGLYHENHCLQQYRNAFAQGTADIDLAHIHHCLNYLRLWSLCRADLTLEPGDFAARDFTEDRLGVTHTCRNWNGVIDRVNTEWDNWIPVWRELHNISSKLNRTFVSESPLQSRFTQELSLCFQIPRAERDTLCSWAVLSHLRLGFDGRIQRAIQRGR